MIASLERRVLIERTVDPGHGRILQMRLTDGGATTLASARQEVEVMESELLGGVPLQERQQLLALLWTCADNIGAGIKRGSS